MNAVALNLRRLRRLDAGVALPSALLVLAGLALVRSADLGTGDLHLVQLKWLGVSLAVALPLMLVPYPKLVRAAPWFFLGGLGLLAAVLLFAPAVNGARRWLPVGGFRFQPSEVMKVFTVLFLARWCRRGEPMDRFRRWFPTVLICGAPAALIFLQPDLGTSLLHAPLLLAVLWCGGMPLRKLLLLVVLAAAAGASAWHFALEDYQKERIWSTYNLDRMTVSQRAGPGYQLSHSLAAIGGGGVFGQGHGEGELTQSGRLPYQHNDFIFAVAAEEHGLLGASALLLLYLVLVVAVFRIAHTGRDPAGRILCVGAGTLLGAQALVHVAVTLGLAPTKGIPLPLVSAGGTSLLATISALALVQNVALNRPRVPLAGLAPRETSVRCQARD